MRTQGAAPAGGTTGRVYRIAEEVRISSENGVEAGIAGLFFRMPERWQHRRIRELSRAGLSADLIALITGRELNAILPALGMRL